MKIMTTKHTLERVSDTEIEIKRAFQAPADLVFEAWTNPDLVRLWWAPKSRGVTMAECTADVRVDGTFRYVLAHSRMGNIVFHGAYVEISRPVRLVYTVGMEPVPGMGLVTIRFEERDGVTTVVSRERYPSKEVLDGVLKSGMEDGARETYEQLDALLAAR
jgi:uncharacterized protein YndB with AHSA1/START domain